MGDEKVKLPKGYTLEQILEDRERLIKANTVLVDSETKLLKDIKKVQKAAGIFQTNSVKWEKVVKIFGKAAIEKAFKEHDKKERKKK